jgi:hypothetical protein
LEATSRVVGQAKKFSQEIAQKVKRGHCAVLRKVKKALDEMIPRVQQVIGQARQRIWEGNTHADGKLLSVFETHTEVIRKGKPVSRMSSANWSRSKRPKIRSLRTTKFARRVRPIPHC